MKEEDIEVPESEWTKGQREFVGSTFPTPKGGVLTVVGVNSCTKSNGRHWGQKFNLICSICSEEKDLWPYGSISSTKNNLEKGKTPCGCRKVNKYSLRDFIGFTITTPRGGTLTVTRMEKHGNVNRFVCNCSICSQDTELWPDGSISTLKHFLEKGASPCGCTRTPRWTKRQYKIKVERECKTRGFKFLGFVEYWKGKDTKLILKDLETQEVWKSTSIHKFLTDKTGNPYKAQRRKLKGDMSRKYRDNDERILLKSGYPEGSTFKLLKGNRWEVTCSKCKDDFYSHVDGGRFKTILGSLLKGVKSCRCSSNHIWSQDEREAEMRHLLSPDNGEFLWWKSTKGYENAHSKFVWRCHRGHVTDSAVNTIKSKSRCRYCKKEDMIARGWANGYMPDKKEKLDNLYILNFDNLYGKIGRAFDIGVRVRKGEGLSKLSGVSVDDIKICHVFSGTHEEVYWVEQMVISRLRREGLSEDRYAWNTELFLDGYEDYVRDCVNQLGILKEV